MLISSLCCNSETLEMTQMSISSKICEQINCGILYIEILGIISFRMNELSMDKSCRHTVE